MPTALNLVYATDGRGALGLAVSASSAIAHLPYERPLNIWVLEDKLNWKQRVGIADSVRCAGRSVAISFIPLRGEQFQDLLRSKAVPHTAYARLVMGQVLPLEVKRCVYLDIDTLCQTSIEPLHDIDLSGATVGAILNSSSAEEGAKQFHRLGIEGSRYFNSGVLVCDLEAWRTHRVGERALAFARSAGSKLVLWDQDALNATLVGDWLELPERWNRWASSSGPLEDCIIHFTMSPKPWHADYRGRGGDLFWSLVDETAFRGTRPWNPFGLGSTIRRLRARIPYAPTVGRVLRETISTALRS